MLTYLTSFVKTQNQIFVNIVEFNIHLKNWTINAILIPFQVIPKIHNYLNSKNVISNMAINSNNVISNTKVSSDIIINNDEPKLYSLGE